MIATIKDLLSQTITGPYQSGLIDTTVLLLIAVVAVVSYFIAKGLLYLIDKAVKRTPTSWDDDMLTHRLFRAVAQLAPALIVSWLLPNFFDDATALHHWARVLTSFYIVWAVVHIINITLSNLYTALSKRPQFKAYAVKGVFQMCKLIAIGLGVIIGLSLIIGKTPLAIITAIGASAAVLMLVFRDTILGLVASVQLTANKMLHRGDWIIAPKYDVNGEVVDVSLTTVKVRNWDNSISTIPPYSLVSDSFRNYQAMRDSGGRRVDRSVLIDLNSVRFLSDKELARLADSGMLQGSDADNGPRPVNLTLFRSYMEHYLATSPVVNPDMLFMVRQMEPTAQGLPVQIYFFTPITDWKEFEHIQGLVMDHVYASVSAFGLRIFQAPSGSDIASLKSLCSE